ncbi:MAG: hypothetical protein Q8942_05205, partial [Bacillota bacterium]|nr:hypothetical protein [Bacillota bacterium]
MNKCLVICILIALMILCSCSNTPAPAKRSPKSSALHPTAKIVTQSKSGSSLKVKYIILRNIPTNQEVKNDNQYLIKEFLQYIKSQSYSKNTEKWDKEYTVKLMGQDEQPIVEITFGGRSIDFDRDLIFDGISIKRGTYEVEEWVEDYLRNYYSGQILNPSLIKLPASMKINDEYTAEDLIDHGSTKISNYDLIPQLTDFFNSNIINKDFNIIDYRVIHSLKDMDLEVES